MAAKTKINETGDCIYTETDAIELLYNNPDLDAEDFNYLTSVSSEFYPPYTDVQVVNGSRYFYSISALDDALGESDRSAITSALPSNESTSTSSSYVMPSRCRSSLALA